MALFIKKKQMEYNFGTIFIRMKFLSLFVINLISIALLAIVIAVPVFIIVNIPSDETLLRGSVFFIGAYFFFVLGWWSWQFNYAYWTASTGKSFLKRMSSWSEIQVDLVLGLLSTILAFITLYFKGYL